MKWGRWVGGLIGAGLLLAGVLCVPGVRYRDTVVMVRGLPVVVRCDRITGDYSMTLPGAQGWTRFEEAKPGE